MQIRNYSPRTIDNYLASVARISVYYRISPDKLTGEQIKDYLQKRIDSGKFSPSAVNQLISALRILLIDVLGRKWEEFYIKRPRREKRLPVVFSKEEIERMLDVTRNLKHKAIISLTCPLFLIGPADAGSVARLLAEVINKGDIFLPGDFSWKNLKDKLYQKNWNVYAKSLLSGPDRVIEYLGRYTHRVAISNSRILSVENDQITFKIKDYRTVNYSSTLTLPVVEFLRRFFQHVLPSGFYKIRYFGFLSLSTAKELVGLIFGLLEKSQFLPRFEGLNGMEIYQEISGKRHLT